MSELKQNGTIVLIGEKQQISDSFAKREFVIETDGDYPQLIKFELTQAKCSELDSYKVGDNVDVSFNLRGRKWTNKEGKDVYFNTLQAWMIAKVGEAKVTSDIPPMDNRMEDDVPF